MKSRFNNALTSSKHHIKSLRIALVCLTVISCVLGYGWHNAPKNLTIHVPPDLRAGSTQAWWKIPEANVYGFTYYIFQQLNSWSNDGSKDYLQQINRLKPFLTPKCYEYFKEDYRIRFQRHELEDRSRHVGEIPGRGFDHDRVQVLSDTSWNVILDLQTSEYYKNDPIKKVLVRYHINTVRYDADQEQNPWGLALNCYVESPKRIELKEKEMDNE